MATKRKTSDESRPGMVKRDLTAPEVEERADKLASAVSKRDEVAEKKRSHNRKWNEDLKQLDTDISQLAQEVEEKAAWVSAQMQFSEGDLERDPDETTRKPGRGRARKPAGSNWAKNVIDASKEDG